MYNSRIQHAWVAVGTPVGGSFRLSTLAAGDLPALLRDIRRRIHTDTDRTYIIGEQDGADAAWMSKMAGYSREENVRDAEAGARMFEAINTVPAIVMARVHGAALGGGCGLAAVCDIVVADEAATFGFTETKLGILPAMISPYVLQKIGASAARELFLTGRRFDATRAREIGLVHSVVPKENLDSTIGQYVSEALSAAPTAVARAKALIPRVLGRPTTEVMAITTEAIAAQRVSAEGQDGLKAFLAKGKPGWVPDEP